SRKVFSLEDMNTTTAISTDLVTPLGAYLRLRESESAAFLLESVEQGRLGRYSFVGSGSRPVSFEEAEGLDEPVVGYVGYDYISKLEPTVPLPAEGPDAAESRLVVAERLVRFDHVTSTAEVLAGDRDEIAQALSRPAADPATYRPARSHAPKR